MGIICLVCLVLSSVWYFSRLSVQSQVESIHTSQKAANPLY